MLSEALTGLAAAGGTAVVQAVGTDLWGGLRDHVARLFDDSEDGTEEALALLDETASELVAAPAHAATQVQNHSEMKWRTRFEALLASLPEDEREEPVELLQSLIRLVATDARSSSPGASGLVVSGDVEISADRGSSAAGVLHGGVRITNHPPRPGADQS